MPEDGTLYRADWWPEKSEIGAVPAAVEAERTDENEVALYVRGVSGESDHGIVYLTDENAREVANAILVAVREEVEKS